MVGLSVRTTPELVTKSLVKRASPRFNSLSRFVSIYRNFPTRIDSNRLAATLVATRFKSEFRFETNLDIFESNRFHLELNSPRQQHSLPPENGAAIEINNILLDMPFMLHQSEPSSPLLRVFAQPSAGPVVTNLRALALEPRSVEGTR